MGGGQEGEKQYERPSPVVAPIKAAWPHPEWTEMLVKSLEDYGSGLLAGYYPGTCGDKKEFWVALLVELARFESNWKTETKFTETFNDSKGKPVVSRGLFQLSIESANGYGCKLKKPEELHDPATNIRCAVIIANKWVTSDMVIHGKSGNRWVGLSRYWSPLRDAEKTKAIMDKARGTCQ